MYKSLQINEQVTYQDETYSGCYIKVIDISIPSFNQMKAEVLYSAYKTKQISEQHPEWQISVDQIQQIFLPFQIGDIINYDTVAGGIKQYLLAVNPTWYEENIVIE